MNDPIIAFGWIPNITGDIFLMNPFLELEQFEIEEYQSRMGKEELEYISKFSSRSFQVFQISDLEEDEPALFVYLFSNEYDKFPSEIQLFSSENSKYFFVCDIQVKDVDKRGLIQFFFKKLGEWAIDLNIDMQQALLTQTLFSLENVYSSTHVLHSADRDAADNRAIIVFTHSRKEAIILVIQEYKKKLHLFRKYIDKLTSDKGYFVFKHRLEISLNFVEHAFIELDYAKKFLLFFKADFDEDDFNILNGIFENGLLWLKQKSKNFEQHYNKRMIEQNNLIIKITFIGVIVALLTLFSNTMPEIVRVVAIILLTTLLFFEDLYGKYLDLKENKKYQISKMR
jgi:hypothetical protein